MGRKPEMNKAELVAVVADKMGGDELDARRYVDAVFEAIMIQVAAGDRVQVLGFGTFDRVERAARIGRNPQTGDRIQVPAGTSPRFHAGQTFRTRVTGASEPSSATSSAPAQQQPDLAGAEVAVKASSAVKPGKKKAVKTVKPVKAEKKAKAAGKKPGKPATATATATVTTKTGPAKKAKQKPVKAGKNAKK
jgi:DNA-binding protein HU-beta